MTQPLCALVGIVDLLVHHLHLTQVPAFFTPHFIAITPFISFRELIFLSQLNVAPIRATGHGKSGAAAGVVTVTAGVVTVTIPT